MPMATKRGRMITYLDGLLFIKSNHSLIILWSCEITWQAKTIVSSLRRCLWLPLLLGWWLTLRGSNPQNHMMLWSRSLSKLSDKNHYVSTTRRVIATKISRMVTYLDGLLIIRSHGSLFTWSFKITWQTNISVTTVPMATKPV